MTRPELTVDPGNRFTKWIDCQTVRAIPSYVKELADWEEGGNDAQSFEIGYSGRRYLVGRLAQLMGGSPAFESGKADLAHLLILPALASDSPQRIERLVIPTPDSRNQQTITKLKELETTIKFSVNGHECLSTICSVVAVDECRGAYDLALGRGMWRYPNNPNGVLDIGAGTAIARLFAPGGALLRDADIVLPGTAHLAQRLAVAILPKVGNTADAGMLMDAIASGNLYYGSTDIDFSREFAAVRGVWTVGIRAKLKANWAKYLPLLGELVVIGGSASLLQPMCEASKGRFKVAPKPSFFICTVYKRRLITALCEQTRYKSSYLNKLPGMPLNKRFILQVPKLSDPNNHQPTKQNSTYLDPITRQQNSVPSVSDSSSSESAGTPQAVPETDSPKPVTPYQPRVTRAERLKAMLAKLMAGTVETAVFAADSPLEQDEKMELAKLVIAQDLGLEKTILLLWVH